MDDPRQLSMFEASHIVRVSYWRDGGDINPDEAYCTMLNLSGETHKPRPLIENNAVIENTEYRRSSGYALESRYAATIGQSFTPMDPHRQPQIRRLLFDMMHVVECFGTTWLGFTSFVVNNAGEPMLRLKRKTQLGLPIITNPISEETYTVSLADFKSHCDELFWYDDIMHLICGQSDLAIRNLQMQWPAFSFWNGAFLPPRELDIARSIALATVKANIGQLSRDDEGKCPTCWLYWHEIDCPILRLQCCNQFFCQECLIKDSTEHGFEYLCPKCRRMFFSPTIKGQIVFGQDRHGNYRFDERFTEWENHERSFADLDEPGAHVDDVAAIRIVPRIFLAAWEYVCKQAKAEPHTSTPKWLNLSLLKDFEIVDKAIRDVVVFYASMTTLRATPAEFIGRLWTHIRRVHSEHLLASPIRQLIGGTRPLDELHNWEYVATYLAPSGYVNYLNMLMNRTVNFMTYRICQCEGKSGMHLHGDCRQYYSTWQPLKRMPSFKTTYPRPTKRRSA